MAENLHVARNEGGFRMASDSFTDVDFSSGSTATVNMDGLKRIESAEDVSAQAQGSGDSDSNEGRAIVAESVSGRQVTLHEYVGGGAGAALDDGTTMDVDHVRVLARGY